MGNRNCGAYKGGGRVEALTRRKTIHYGAICACPTGEPAAPPLFAADFSI